MKKQITEKDLTKYIQEATKKLMEVDNVIELGDPLDVEMNQMVGKGEKMTTKANAKDPINAKMNDMDTEATSQGKEGAVVMASDKKVTTKTTTPATSTGEPFTEKAKDEMNQMDEEGDDTVKTFVKASGKMNSDQESNTGMNKPEFKEEAQNEKEKEKKIADAIEIKEGMKFGKSELLEWCSKEANKISKLL